MTLYLLLFAYLAANEVQGTEGANTGIVTRDSPMSEGSRTGAAVQTSIFNLLAHTSAVRDFQLMADPAYAADFRARWQTLRKEFSIS